MFIGIALSVTARLLGGGFSPAVLFALNEPGVWLDPSDLTTLFQDTAGTIPVTAAGQSVARVSDKSGRGNHATQATPGFRPTYQVDGTGRGHLLFDGVDDFLQTPSIDFSTTNKMTVFAGVRKLSDAAVGVIAELTVDSNSNPAFALFAPSGAGVAAYNFRSRGTLSAGATSATSFAAPITNVLTGIGDISGDSSIIRVNGALSGNSASDQGAGNYSNAVIYIGRRAGTSLPFSGRLYSLIVRGAATTAADITATETWVNSRTGAY